LNLIYHSQVWDHQSAVEYKWRCYWESQRMTQEINILFCFWIYVFLYFIEAN
jgi:hypothetical protein